MKWCSRLQPSLTHFTIELIRVFASTGPPPARSRRSLPQLRHVALTPKTVIGPSTATSPCARTADESHTPNTTRDADRNEHPRCGRHPATPECIPSRHPNVDPCSACSGRVQAIATHATKSPRTAPQPPHQNAGPSPFAARTRTGSIEEAPDRPTPDEQGSRRRNTGSPKPTVSSQQVLSVPRMRMRSRVTTASTCPLKISD